MSKLSDAIDRFRDSHRGLLDHEERAMAARMRESPPNDGESVEEYLDRIFEEAVV